MDFDEFMQVYMRKGGKYIPARLQTALGLLEKLREHQTLELRSHLASAGSSGLESHELWGNKAHERMNLDAINKNHGRRSSSLQDWGQQLLDILRAAQFESSSADMRVVLIETAQSKFAEVLKSILQQEPFQVRVKGRSAEAVIQSILEQADGKGKCGDVAQYLVGAKLQLRLGIEIPIHAANLGDRRARGDRDARLGDFEIEDAIIEVAVGLPDEKHITQIVNALEDGDKEVWLLTRSTRVKTWQDELKDADGIDHKRTIVDSVEGFVGQNISELGGFSAQGRVDRLRDLFRLYNDRWIANLGLPGLRVELL